MKSDNASERELLVITSDIVCCRAHVSKLVAWKALRIDKRVFPLI